MLLAEMPQISAISGPVLNNASETSRFAANFCVINIHGLSRFVQENELPSQSLGSQHDAGFTDSNSGRKPVHIPA